MAKYKIVLDTNIIHDNDPKDLSALFRSDLDDLYNFLKNNPKLSDVAIAIPKMVIDERIAQRMLQIESSIGKIEASFEQLGSFGIKEPADNYKKEDYKFALQKNADEIAKKYSIEILPTPGKLQEKLIERSLKKTKPFRKEKDVGFKDTIIWLAILGDAEENGGVEYIFCTDNDADFDAEEFKTLFGREIKIIKNLGALKEYLDSELVLNLKLKALNGEIEAIIKKKYIPEIMMKINSELNETPSSGYLNLRSSPFVSVYPSLSQSPTIAYRLKDMTFRNISKSGADDYDIDLEVAVVPIKKQESFVRFEYMEVFNTTIDSPAINCSLKIGFKKDADFINIRTVDIAQTFFVSATN